MSHSLVTLSCVMVFLSIIPHTTSAPIVEDSADWMAIKDFLIENIHLTPDCTAPTDADMDTLVSTIRREVTALTSTVASDDIKNAVTSMFENKRDLDESESTKIYAHVARVALIQECTKVSPTLSDRIRFLHNLLLHKANLMIRYDQRSSKSITISCLIFNILKAVEASSGSFPSPGSQVVNDITEAVNAINIAAESFDIGTGRTTPSDDLISKSFESGKNNPEILNYIGSPPSEDAARRCIVTCYHDILLTKRLNPELPVPLRKKLEDYLIANYEFGKDCRVPNAAALHKLAEELVKPGNLLENSHTRTVQATLHDIFAEAKLTESEGESAIIIVSRLAVPPPTCSAKSPLLSANNNPLLGTALTQMEVLSSSNGWGLKKRAFLCFLQKFYDEVKASSDFAVESLSNDLKEEIKEAVSENEDAIFSPNTKDNSDSTTTAAPVNQFAPLAEVTKVFMAAKEKTKTKEWMDNNAGRHASVICIIDTLLTEKLSKLKKDKENNVGSEDKDDGSGPELSTITIVIICLAVIFALIIVVVSCYLLMRKRKNEIQLNN